MGLAWIPLGKPKPGSEGDHLAALGALTAPTKWPAGTPVPFRTPDDVDAMRRLLEASEITPHETLDAPRVGRDARADAWIRERYTTARKKPATIEDWMWSYEGFRVLLLLPDNDGLPVYSDAGFGGTERFAFCGKFLDDCTDLLGEELHREAYLNHLPDQLARYGQALMDAATAHAEVHGVEEVLGRRVLDYDAMQADTPGNRAMGQVHVVASAARWALWWSARGHGLDADW